MTIALNQCKSCLADTLSCNRIETCRNALVYVPPHGRLCIKPLRAGQGIRRAASPGSSSTSMSLRNRRPLGVARQVLAPFHQPAGHRRGQRLLQDGDRKPGAFLEQMSSRNLRPAENHSWRIRTAVRRPANRLSHQRTRIRGQITARFARLLGAHDDAACRIRNLAVRARTNAQVIAEVPVVEVMDAARAGRA